jgi:glycosyltransferase involved in cell wall biosynthesis
MKILQIHNKYIEKGGEDTVVANERQLLQQHGHAVELCEFDNKDLDSLSKINLLSRTFFNTQAYKKLTAHIEIFKPDVIHIHNVFYEASPSIFWAIAKKNIPAVMTLHNYRFGCVQGLLFRKNKVCQLCLEKKSAFYGIKNKCFKDSYLKSLQLTLVNKFYQWTLKHKNPVKKYIFLADFNKKMLSSVLSLKNIEYNEIPNAFGTVDAGNPDAFGKGVLKPNYVNDFGFTPMSERSDYYLFVGRLNEQKGVHILIDIFKKNKKKLEIIGEGPMVDLVKEAAKNHSNIRYLGYADNTFIIQKLRQSRGLIVPSLTYEGQPMTILEAFSTGTPVFASDTKNMDSMITHGYNGFLFQPEKDHAIFDNLDALDKEDLYKNARLTYEEKYSPQKNYDYLMDIYQSVISVSKT